MRFFNTLFLVTFFSCTSLQGQVNQWTWVSGNKVADQSGNYGTRGVAAATNYPGTRSGSISFTDKAGNFWLFGGNGIDEVGGAGLLNDLWKWDGTNWTWISGSKSANQPGKHGIKGIADATNVPGCRHWGAGSRDNNGNIWLFGGEGFSDSSLYGRNSVAMQLNDLWKWDGTNWTWVKGSNQLVCSGAESCYFGKYGKQGIADAGNTPGVRKNCAGWTDTNGNFWLFGGSGYADSSYTPYGSSGLLNDLWKWDGNNWTWINGSNSANTLGINGTKGITASYNLPASRAGSITWSDRGGNFWLFGGNTFFGTGIYFAESNDLWKWDGANWTWVSGSDTANAVGKYGVQGMASPLNMPGARENGSGWTDSAGRFWLFGGNASIPGNVGGITNELWKWDGINWTWVRGSGSQTGMYGTKGVAAASNTPGARLYSMNWTDKNGKLFLFGGEGVHTSLPYDFIKMNDQWSWDGSNWTWLNGIDSAGINDDGAYGTIGVSAAANRPPAKANGVSWTDKTGNLWLFGGESRLAAYSYFNDTWKWDGSNWTWVKGSKKTNLLGDYGVKGVTAASNFPGSRSGSANWLDNSGNLWMFGGYGMDTLSGQSSFTFAPLNDLWKWDGTNWTFMNGKTKQGKFGTRGVADTSNIPYQRSNSVYWSDKAGNFWMFGGNVYDGPLGINNFNDMWKWDGKSWTWMKGPDVINTVGVYGTKGVADTANNPGARDGSITWKDSSNNVWLFGGRAGQTNPIRGAPFPVSGYYNDLWKWDGTNWTWISGNNAPGLTTGMYGTKGVASASNMPGGRIGSTSWVDNNGNFWLFGGYGVDAKNTLAYLNDVWVWNGKNWTWVAGSDQANQFGSYGTLGMASSTNRPAARFKPFAWPGKTESISLFGGFGSVYGSVPVIPINTYGYYSDLWQFKYGLVTALPAATAPVNLTTLVLLNNPSATDQFSMLSDRFYQKLNWQLLDNTGRLLQSGIVRSVIKGSVITAPTRHIAPGIYFIKLVGDDKILPTQKWIKQ